MGFVDAGPRNHGSDCSTATNDHTAPVLDQWSFLGDRYEVGRNPDDIRDGPRRAGDPTPLAPEDPHPDDRVVDPLGFDPIHNSRPAPPSRIRGKGCRSRRVPHRYPNVDTGPRPLSPTWFDRNPLGPE